MEGARLWVGRQPSNSKNCARIARITAASAEPLVSRPLPTVFIMTHAFSDACHLACAPWAEAPSASGTGNCRRGDAGATQERCGRVILSDHQPA